MVGAIAHIWLYGCYKILEHAATAAWMGEAVLDVEREDASGTVFRDAILLSLLGLMLIIVILLQYFNPPTQEAAKPNPPGNVIVEIEWPNQSRYRYRPYGSRRRRIGRWDIQTRAMRC